MTQQVNTRHVAAPEQRPVVLDFEDLTTGERGGGGGPIVRVFDQYQTVRVQINGAAALDYSKGVLAIPSFAHSGTATRRRKRSARRTRRTFCGTCLPVSSLVAAPRRSGLTSRSRCMGGSPCAGRDVRARRLLEMRAGRSTRPEAARR